MEKQNKILKINENDNVAVALTDLSAGEQIALDGKLVQVRENIEKGHKLAVTFINAGEKVIKYAFPIGYAIRDIAAGEFVHTHNIKTTLDEKVEYSYQPSLIKNLKLNQGSTFMGYVREDGTVGVRNEIWIINTVGCVNKTAELLGKKANELFQGKTDGIFAFPHPYGCSQMGDDQTATQKILANMVRHPNAAGVLVLGLGCENNNIPEFKKLLGDYNPQRVRFLATQEVEDEIAEGLKLIQELVQYASVFVRQECPASRLIAGLKCGGSDAFSGITANPLLGVFSDKLLNEGGTVLLTEVPEMFGAETILMNRCIDHEIFDKSVTLINDFKDYYTKHNQIIYDNPSPGNKKGGISTLEEKSLGCIKKGGEGNVMDVLDYGDIVKTLGLNLLNGPGNDIVAVTNLMAAGAQLILFTTGRGTPLGAPVPTVKISTNTELANRKSNWIDFNAGQLLDGVTLDELSAELYQTVLQVASGVLKAKNEINNYREISIFKNGVTL